MAIVKLTDASRAQPLFNELGYNLALDSIIAGITKGLAFADNEDKPQTALLWNLMDTLFLAGLPGDSEINQQIN